MARTVVSAFNELIARQGLTARQRDLAFNRIADIGAFVAGRCALAEPVFAIGSFARGTMCEGERDIDLMMVLDDRTYWARYQFDSRRFLYDCRDTLAERYPRTEVSSRQVAVVLDFNEIRTDLVPAFPLRNGGLYIPNGRGGWQMTNPRYHMNLIAQRDRELAGQLKTIVKLLKVWNLANGQHLSSVHIELMVAAVERLPITSWPVEVMFCLEQLLVRTNTAFPDPWNPAIAIDQDLPQAERALARRLLQADLERARQAEAYRQTGRDGDAIERWRVVYTPLFPAFG